MNKSISVYFISLVILVTNCESKWWIENPEFNNPRNWENGEIPCPMDKIIFPKLFSSAIFTPIDLKTNGIIFPAEGSILLHSNSKISFTNINDKNQMKNYKCNNQNYLSKIKTVQRRSWFNPKNWKTLPGMEQNPATPHIERIPCSNEQVIMGLDGALSVDLDYVDELSIGGMLFGRKDLTSEQLQSFFQSSLGQWIFKNAEDTNVKYLNEPICGCHKVDNVIEYQWKVCKFAKNTCEIPKCVNPIVPTGHCCKECGSSLKLHIENCTSFNMNTFKRQIGRALKDQQLSNDVYVDYRMVNDGDDAFLQLVILDKNDYSEKSVKLMNILKETFFRENYNSLRKTFHMSGMPYTPGETSSGWIFMLISLLGVLTFFAILIAYYMPEKSPIALPAWIYSSRCTTVFNSPFVFARFDNNQPDVEISGAVNVSDSAQTEGTSTAQGTTSFNNPMFDESAEKPSTQESGGPLEDELTEVELVQE